MSACFALAIWLWGQSAPAALANAVPPALQVRAFADSGVDRAVLARSHEIAERLLAAAGVATSWRLCDGSRPCEAAEGPVPEVVVILTARERPVGRSACGVAVGSGASKGTVIVSVPCLADWLLRLSRDRAFFAQPSLAMPVPDDVVGAAVAHEIGHIFGLRHGRTGIMRAALRAGDVLDLRRGELAFARQDATRMRTAVLSAQTALISRAGRSRTR